MKFIELESVTFDIYSEDPSEEPENMKRPEILFSDDVEIFSPLTRFCLYDSYTLMPYVKYQLGSLVLKYDNEDIEMLVVHTNLTLKNLIFRCKLPFAHKYRGL